MRTIEWTGGGIRVVIDAPEDDFAALTTLGPAGTAARPRSASAVPLCEVRAGGDGGSLATSERVMGGRLSRRLRVVGSEVTDDGLTLAVTQHDRQTGVRAVSRFEAFEGIAAVRCSTAVTADAAPVTLHAVSSTSVGGLGAPGRAWGQDLLGTADNSWCREVSWRVGALADEGLDDAGPARWGYASGRAAIIRSVTGTWSAGGRLPVAFLTEHDTGRTVAWQIEAGGPWRWELGDYGDAVYLSAGGPAGPSHGWSHRLAAGETFTTPPVALVFGDGVDDVLAESTRYRRRTRRPHADHRMLPVVANDFMNALMGDPTEQTLLPLIAAAADVGAEVFCIDAGWFADTDWWSAVGDWMPSPRRFPRGIAAVTDAIRSRGMVAGLWLEPEAVGLHSAAARTLPDAAFFRRDGERVIEAGRYPLDFRHPAARAHVDAAVDRAVTHWGIGYLKLDANIDVTAGTDVAAASAVDGILGHMRAYLGWLDDLATRYPDLTIENCASGGQRIDHAFESRTQLQSMTDNQDPLSCAAIAASAPSAVAPEQAAAWSYPDPGFSDERIAVTMINGMVGRMHLAGRIDLLDARQKSLVRAAIDAYRGIRHLVPVAVPSWPLGLPGWHDDWLALALRAPHDLLLAVWRRGGPTEVRLALPVAAESVLTVVHPDAAGGIVWHDGVLTVHAPADEPSARLLRFSLRLQEQPHIQGA